MKEKVTLREIVEGEIVALMSSTISAFHTLNEYASHLNKKEQKKTKNRIKKGKQEIQKLIDTFAPQYQSPQAKFDLETFKLYHTTLKKIERLAPDSEENEKFINTMVTVLDRSIVKIRYEKAVKSLPVLGSLGVAMTAGALYIGAPIAAGIFTAGTIAAALGIVKDSPLKTLTASSAVLFGIAGFSFANNEDFVLSQKIVSGALYLLHIGALPAYLNSSRYLVEKKSFDWKVKKLKTLPKKFEDATPISIIVEEAYRGLKYISKVCDSEKREKAEFEDQLTDLAITLHLYLKGEADFSDVIDSRIKYVPSKTKPKTEQEIIQHESPALKKGYTPKQYKILLKERETQLARNKRKRTGQPTAIEETTDYKGERVEFQVALHDDLDKRYTKRRERVDKYSLHRIVDRSMQRLEEIGEMEIGRTGNLSQLSRHKNIGIITTSEGSGADLLLKHFETNYNIPENATIFRLAATSSVRTIFYVAQNKIKLLDVMDHEAYDKLYKK